MRRSGNRLIILQLSNHMLIVLNILRAAENCSEERIFMSLEENKVLERNSLDLITEKNFACIDQIYSPTYVRHDPDSPQVRTREDYRKYLAGLCTVFPDLHFA